ncbi:MAG: hypothetical protein F7B18_08970 [Desulfurococcales archaeon]|nr:hypothetical protein [Desulfurococcales archaeon]
MPAPLPLDAFFSLIVLTGALAAILGLIAIAREAARGGGQPRPRTAVLWVKSPGELELRDARLAKTGEVLVVDGKETWVYRPPVEYKPVELRVGRRLYKAYIVDKNVHAFYEIPELREEELEQEVEVQGRRIKLNRAMLDPRTLFTYIGSKSMEKLIKPLRVSRGEAIGYMAIGGLMVLLMIFFLLPMLGYQVSIGGGGIFG